MDEMEDFFGNDDYEREASPIGEEAIEDNSAEDGSKRTVEPKLLRKKTLNPRLALNENTLTGPKGIPALREAFKGFKPNPKDDPYKNLDKLMKKYAYWGHLMFPKMKTEDVLSRVETLGTRRQVKLYLAKQRLGVEEDVGEERQSKEQKKNGIIDDGADDNETPNDDLEEDLFGDEPEQVTTRFEPAPEKTAASPQNQSEPIDFDEEEQYARMEEERRREEAEEKNADAEDELLADFDLNNGW